MEKNKKTNLRISKILICIGLAVMILGIVFLVTSIADYNKAKTASKLEYQQKIDKYNQDMIDYEEDYDEWYDNWWNGTGDVTINDQPKKPTHPGFEEIVMPPMMLFFSIFIIMLGLGILISGAMPYITKLSLKHKKETFEFVGNVISNTNNINHDHKTNYTYCSYCGRKSKATEVECPNCGANLK